MGATALSRDAAVDLGTSTVQLYVRDRGIVVEEPSVVAVDRRSREVADVGRSALYLVENAPETFEAVWPMRAGAVDDAVMVQRMLSRLLKPLKGGFFDRLRVLLCVPSSTTPIERRVLRDAVNRAGGSGVQLIASTMAAALGGGLPVHEPIGTMVVDVGAGVTEASLISLGCIVGSSSARAGSADVDVAIVNVLRREYGVTISPRTAEDIKLALSRLPHEGNDLMIEAKGHHAVEGSAVTALLERDEIQPVLDEYVTGAVQAVKDCLVQAPPELAQDLIGRGMYLAGGGALLGGLADRLTRELSIPVHVLEDPDRVTIMGAGKCLEAMESLRRLFISDTHPG